MCLDPTFLIDKNVYTDLIVKSNNNINYGLNDNDKYVATYFITEDVDNMPFQSEIQDLLKNHKVINIKGEYISSTLANLFIYNSIPKWLLLLKNCDYLITDSYHGVIFAIIFEKDFVCIPKSEISATRYNDLFKDLSITPTIIKNKEEIINILNLSIIDYSAVNIKLIQLINKSRKFLLDSLKKDNNVNNQKLSILMKDLSNRKSENEVLKK